MGTLAFLITLLAFLVSLVIAVIDLLRRRGRSARKIGLGMLVWLAVYGLVLLAVSFTSPRSVLGPGQEYCFDEMCYSVRGASTAQALGQDSSQGHYLMVDIALRNAAKRSAQKPSQPEIWVVDPQGRRYTQILSAGDRPGQPIDPHQLWDQKIQPGETSLRKIAFDLPAEVVQPKLVIVESSWPTPLIIGDENSFFHPKPEFQLPISSFP